MTAPAALTPFARSLPEGQVRDGYLAAVTQAGQVLAGELAKLHEQQRRELAA